MASTFREVRIKSTTVGLKSVVEAADHTFNLDEPAAIGGTNTGPNPLEAFLGALAGCENVTARFVAKEMDFDLAGMTFEISGSYDSRGLKSGAEVRPNFRTLEIRVNVETTESEERLKRLQEETDRRCPVFSTLEAAGIEVSIDWRKV
ncbi:MAG TPA: OsmC family protein [Bacillales bacterium]|nr:OsmC family protein [Bacillales bacterium]